MIKNKNYHKTLDQWTKLQTFQMIFMTKFGPLSSTHMIKFQI